MRLLHTSDWHFGMSAGMKSLEEDQYFFLEQLYRIIEQEQVDAVLLAGDVYDSSVSNADAIVMYNEAVTTICVKMKKTFVVIAGNHDGAARLASCRELLKSAGLYVTGRLMRDIEPVLVGNTDIYPVPFFNREEVAALFPERKDEVKSQESAFQIVCDHIREKMDKSRKNIVVSHALIVNAELSESDRSARVGYADAVSKDVFAGFDYVALGHIHKPQEIAPGVCYSGSPLKFSFGLEEKQEKGVFIYDTDALEVKKVPIRQLHDWKSVEGTYEELLDRTDLTEDYLRLKVTDRYAGLELLSELREHFPYLLELQGKSLEENGELTALTMEELNSMDEEDILKKFFAENFQYEPDEGQIALYRDVLAWSQKEGALE